MGRYEKMFDRLKERDEAAFVPFVVIGDPDLESSAKIIQTLVESGADALELGFPFSDPLADGPTIQGAMDRALQADVTPADCFDLIGQLRKTDQETPVGLLVYANIVYAYGVARFYKVCADVGVDSVLVADVPLGEVEAFREQAVEHSVDAILLCPPNIDDDSLRQLSDKGSGYTYLLSRAGVTGTNVAAGMPVQDLLAKINAVSYTHLTLPTIYSV